MSAARRTKHGMCGTPEYHMFQSARFRSKEQGLAFDLDLKDIVIPLLCPLLATPIVCGEGTMTASSPSLDRIHPEKGYVKGNIQVISYRANAIKQNASIEELELLTSNLRRILGRAK